MRCIVLPIEANGWRYVLLPVTGDFLPGYTKVETAATLELPLRIKNPGCNLYPKEETA